MRLRSELVSLLRDVVTDHQPDLLSVVDQLISGTRIMEEDRGKLIDLLLSEVARTGFYESDESIKRGFMLEEIGDMLSDMYKNNKI